MADEVRRYVVRVHQKTGEHAVLDTKTGELLDVYDCVRLLNKRQVLTPVSN